MEKFKLLPYLESPLYRMKILLNFIFSPRKKKKKEHPFKLLSLRITFYSKVLYYFHQLFSLAHQQIPCGLGCTHQKMPHNLMFCSQLLLEPQRHNLATILNQPQILWTSYFSSYMKKRRHMSSHSVQQWNSITYYRNMFNFKLYQFHSFILPYCQFQ